MLENGYRKFITLLMTILVVFAISGVQTQSGGFSPFRNPNVPVHMEEDESAHHFVQGQVAVRYQRNRSENHEHFNSRHPLPSISMETGRDASRLSSPATRGVEPRAPPVA